MDTIVILQTVDGNMRKVTETKSIKSKQVQFSDTQATKTKKGWKKKGSVKMSWLQEARGPSGDSNIEQMLEDRDGVWIQRIACGSRTIGWIYEQL